MNILRPKVGGHPAKLDDLNLIQNAYAEGFKALASVYNNNLKTILSGINITQNGNVASWTSGYVIYKGEPFIVDSGSINTTGATLCLKVLETILPPSPVTYKDKTIQNVHFMRKMTVGYMTSSDDGDLITNFNTPNFNGIPSGSKFDWTPIDGNVSNHFDTNGLGINDMYGYAIMNGATHNINGKIITVPDERGRFSVMATSGYGSSNSPNLDQTLGNYALGEKGGLLTVSLTADQNGLHSHVVVDNGHTHHVTSTSYNDTGGSGRLPAAKLTGTEDGGYTDMAKTGITINNSGLGNPHENRPPYSAGIRIIKII